ncbi:MAG: PEGA domain-containing protein [candidate division KSB1 bacterium]|nr:PEGA domain-containing protein [candidate division KSB1 bacterium]
MNTRTGYRVCIQVLEEPFSTDLEATLQFTHQFDVGKKIMHRNMLRVYDSQIIEGIPVIEYEHFKGVSFKDFVEKKHILPRVRITSIWVKIARTLQHTIFLGIPHGCPAPEYILIDPDTDQIKIFGFGIHHLYDFLYPLYPELYTSILPFIPPEAVQGRSLDSRKADVYAFGVLCYYMLTRILPFYSESIQTVIRQKQELPPSPKDINTHVPVQLADWAMSLLHPVPTERTTLNTFLDYLDPQQDKNVYPDLRKRSIVPRGTIHRIVEPVKAFFSQQLLAVWSNYKAFILTGMGILLILLVTLRVISTFDNENEQLNAAYQEMVETTPRDDGMNDGSPERTILPDSAVRDSTEFAGRADSLQMEKKGNDNGPKVRAASATVEPEPGEQLPQSVEYTISAHANSEPVNARVFIDRNYVGQCYPGRPVSLNLNRGETFLIAVKKDGYQNWERSIRPQNTGANIRAELSPVRAAHRLTITQPDFAERAKIDQGEYQDLPIKIELTPGRHTITFLHSETGFTYTQVLSITADSPDTLSVHRADVGRGNALFVLRNAEEHGYVFVSIDDTQTLQTTPYKTTLSAGPHRVRFSRKGYQVVPQDTVFVVEPDQQVKITCRIMN